MSDIKMSVVFSLPLHTKEGEICDYDNGLMASFDTIERDYAAVRAINSHDALVEQNAALRAALGDVLVEYKGVDGCKVLIKQCEKALEQS